MKKTQQRRKTSRKKSANVTAVAARRSLKALEGLDNENRVLIAAIARVLVQISMKKPKGGRSRTVSPAFLLSATNTDRKKFVSGLLRDHARWRDDLIDVIGTRVELNMKRRKGAVGGGSKRATSKQQLMPSQPPPLKPLIVNVLLEQVLGNISVDFNDAVKQRAQSTRKQRSTDITALFMDAIDERVSFFALRIVQDHIRVTTKDTTKDTASALATVDTKQLNNPKSVLPPHAKSNPGVSSVKIVGTTMKKKKKIAIGDLTRLHKSVGPRKSTGASVDDPACQFADFLFVKDTMQSTHPVHRKVEDDQPIVPIVPFRSKPSPSPSPSHSHSPSTPHHIRRKMAQRAHTSPIWQHNDEHNSLERRHSRNQSNRYGGWQRHKPIRRDNNQKLYQVQQNNAIPHDYEHKQRGNYSEPIHNQQQRQRRQQRQRQPQRQRQQRHQPQRQRQQRQPQRQHQQPQPQPQPQRQHQQNHQQQPQRQWQKRQSPKHSQQHSRQRNSRERDQHRSQITQTHRQIASTLHQVPQYTTHPAHNTPSPQQFQRQHANTTQSTTHELSNNHHDHDAFEDEDEDEEEEEMGEKRGRFVFICD